MAHVVQFRSPSSRGERRPRAEGSVTGEIVIFPGVRYERWGGEKAASAAKRRKRDTLELAD